MNERPQHRDSLEGYFISAVVGVFVVVTMLIAASFAEGGQVCRPRSYAPAQQLAQPVLFQVAPYLQKQAVDTYAFRHSAEWQQYQRLIGYRERAEQELAAIPTPAPGAWDEATGERVPTRAEIEASPGYQGKMNLKTGEWTPAPGYDGPTPIPPVVPTEENTSPAEEIPPAAAASAESEEGIWVDASSTDGIQYHQSEASDSLANLRPAIAAACAKCHSGAEPKGGLDIAAALATVDPDDVIADRARKDAVVAIGAAVANGRMPPAGPLDREDEHQVLVELHLE